MPSEEIKRAVKHEVESQINQSEIRDFMSRIIDSLIELEERIEKLEDECN